MYLELSFHMFSCSSQEIEPHTIESFFGLTDSQKTAPNESGYILFYQSRE